MRTRYLHGGPRAGKSWMARLLLHHGLVRRKKLNNNVEILVWIDEASSMDEIRVSKHIIDNKRDND